jgi:hypothetical protein
LKKIIFEKKESAVYEQQLHIKLNNYDESYILSSHIQQKSWSGDLVHGLLIPVSIGQHLIIIHAGGEYSFVSSALLMWKSHQATGDYHHQTK